VAAKIDAADREYFESEIRNLMDDPLIEYVGEISENEKSEFLGNAYALLFLIDWDEPFGLVMTEAMACGTPVIAYGSGSVPEVIDDGVTGFIVDSVEGAVDAVRRIGSLDRRLIRRIFEKRFSARRMCLKYVEIYQKLRDREPDLTAGESLSSTL
jgi:glycosyltransferase involved in cell wall biosynthesis